MRKIIVAMAIVMVVGLSGTGLYLGTREDLVATGGLSQALLRASPDASELTAVFSQYLPADMALSDRQALLDENGFACSVEAAEVARRPDRPRPGPTPTPRDLPGHK